ncbi:MAG: prepilin-type N-terminal cleavage/methylation domain-containing protein [Candidatus Hydrogenedentes bacterium]|nr:prepilin-type N-terminal cleavage/methylation domain-containing protein [Candidatus Hydrogenedentota bacterium]
MRKSRRSAGFTLLELIVVIGLMGVVSALGGISFFYMMDGWSTLRTRTELDRRAENVLDTMGRDFRTAIASPLAQMGLVGTTQEDGNDLVTIPFAAPTIPDNRVIGAIVQYHVFEGELIRTPYDIDSEEIPETRHAIVKGVVSLRFEYAPRGGGPWQTEWLEEGFPAAVRVSLTLTDPDRPTRGVVSRKAVFPLYVE